MEATCALRLVLALLAVIIGLGRVLAEPSEAPNGPLSPPEAVEPAAARPPAVVAKGSVSGSENSLCLLIESAALANELPYEFFARVIWQESRFRSDAVGPRTRSGARAQGIAQFMPGTAAERRLLDPFDPVQALPKSAEFLHELHQQFGNLGLAAAAYNAGPGRVHEWLAGNGGLPQETRSYVFAITGRTADEWAAARSQRSVPAPRNAPGCGELIALYTRAPNPFVHQLEERVALVAVKPWGVQLAAGFSKDVALTAYSRAIKGMGSVLEGYDPSILSTMLRTRGTRPFYQVRIGADTRPEADGLCGRIRRAGGACLVLRNEPRSG